MPDTKKERLITLLQKLVSSSDIEGAAVITRDGLLIASELRDSIDGDTLAAMAATMTGAAETAVHELKKKDPDRVIVETPDAKLITIGAGKQAILSSIMGPEAKLGLVLMEMKKTADKVKNEVD